MAKMNAKKKAPRMNRTKNHHGETVHNLDALERLFSKVLGSFFGESTHYENRSTEGDFNKLMEDINAVHEKDKEYVLKIAQLGREHNMISYPLQVLTACFNLDHYKGDQFIDPMTGKNRLWGYSDRIIRRALDITEILATQITVNDFSKRYPKKRREKLDNRRNREVPLPMQLRKNLKAKLESFDAFKLSKGLAKSNTVSLKDAICILRPRPANKSLERAYKQILDGEMKLGNGKTQIRSALSNAGQDRPRKDMDIKDAVYKGTLQNILYGLEGLRSAGAFEDNDLVDFIVTKFTTKKEVLNSKLLPFRFYSAYMAIEEKWGESFTTRNNVERIKEAIVDAMELSIENVSKIGGTTAVLVDVSVSMDRTVSDKSSVSAVDIACILGAIAYKKGFGDLYIFASQCEKVNVSRRTPIIEMVRIMQSWDRTQYRRSTNLNDALSCIHGYAKAHALKYDNLIILSDNDCYGYNSGEIKFGEAYGANRWRGYENADSQITAMIGAGTIKKVWINNLLGNDFAVVNTAQHSKNLITGFSEKFVDIIEVHNCIGGNADVRQVIDMLLEKNI